MWPSVRQQKEHEQVENVKDTVKYFTPRVIVVCKNLKSDSCDTKCGKGNISIRHINYNINL